MEKPYRIVLADDHAILRDGLRALFASEHDIELVGEAADGRETIRLVAEKRPDLVVLDLTMPHMSGLDALKEIKAVSEKTRVLVLTVHDSEEFLLAALRKGADGYVLKEATAAEFLLAVRTVLAGRQYLDANVVPKVIAAYVGARDPKAGEATADKLSRREREVLKLIAQGYRTRQIGEFLGLSVKTVEKHRGSLMRKLDLHSAAALAAHAVEKGLVGR